jgi:hypothetical protein
MGKRRGKGRCQSFEWKTNLAWSYKHQLRCDRSSNIQADRYPVAELRMHTSFVVLYKLFFAKPLDRCSHSLDNCEG